MTILRIPGTRRIGASLILASLASLPGGCATKSSWLFYDAQQNTAPSTTSELATPQEQLCAKVAAERADDAVMANYARQGSAAQRNIYEASYRDCMSWSRS